LKFLIDRTIADFETALEATLSGYWAVTFDAMRDVLEIQFLPMDFALTFAHITEWLDADDRTLKNKFEPASVRQRLKVAGVGNLDKMEPLLITKGIVWCYMLGPNIGRRQRRQRPGGPYRGAELRHPG
jgi:hypothetical protein